MSLFSPSTPGAPPPPPPPPPTDLREVDAELKKLGYEDPQTAGGQATLNGKPFGNPQLDAAGKPMSAAQAGIYGASGFLSRISGKPDTMARINELLGYRSKFQAADESVRTTGNRGRASTILAGASPGEDNSASRTLLKVL
jgi:hypothetical protein